MTSRKCSVILVDRSATHQDTLVTQLHSTFGEVTIVANASAALRSLQTKQKYTANPSLLLFDNERGCDEHEDTISVIHSFSSQLLHRSIKNIVTIVLSENEDEDYMLRCLEHGAVDYVLKPLRPDTMKTLFLNLHRYNYESGNEKEITKQRMRTNIRRQGPSWRNFTDRLKGVYNDDVWIPRAIVNYYTPEPTLSRSRIQVSADRNEFLKSRVCSWDFMPLHLSDTDLIHCVFLILEQVLNIPELEEFRVSGDDLYNFIFDICNSYNNQNPYHNFRHAVDVMQTTYYILCKVGVLRPLFEDALAGFSRTRKGSGYSGSKQRKLIQELMRPIDTLALLMASLGHDVGHPGVTNRFLVNTGTPLAMLYNDRSVLENYHSMAFFHILHMQPKLGKLTLNYQRPDLQWFRKLVVHCILMTDMSLHDDFVESIEEQSTRIHTANLQDEVVANTEREVICGAIIKCADIGNCSRPFPLAKRWACNLAEEFFLQGDLEKELELDVLPMNDRQNVNLARFQLAFKRNIAMKLFVALSKIIPEMEFCLDFIGENIEEWTNVLAEDEGEEAAKEFALENAGESDEEEEIEEAIEETDRESSISIPFAKDIHRDRVPSDGRIEGPYVLSPSPRSPRDCTTPRNSQGNQSNQSNSPSPMRRTPPR